MANVDSNCGSMNAAVKDLPTVLAKVCDFEII